ncbi:hypothetical protein EMIT079MI2_100067 [Bacillus sp. IT-79MI2]
MTLHFFSLLSMVNPSFVLLMVDKEGLEQERKGKFHENCHGMYFAR